MALAPQTRLVNPRLGLYFGIFASALTGLALLVMILEQLDVSAAALSAAMLALPLAFYVTIGIASYNQDPWDFFAAGRRVPAFYSGLLLAVSATGATGLVALTGAFFAIGFDTLCLAIGGLAGFVLTAVLLAPFLRKFGAFTLPSYLGRRFDSRLVRLSAAVFLTPPLLLLVSAELRMGAEAASLLSGYGAVPMCLMLGLTLALTLVAGGMRSQTWSGSAQSIAALMALLVPVAIAGVLLTNMPLPQLSHGPILKSIIRDEGRMGLPILSQPWFQFEFPGEGLQAITRRFDQPFSTVGLLAFLTVMLTTMAGVASAPWLLPRVAATPGVYEARKSIGWATVIFGLIMITLASIAVFMREYVFLVVKDPAQQVPVWLSQLAALDLAGIDTASSKLDLRSLSFRRDAILPALPMAAGMPPFLLYVALAGAVAAALAAAGAAVGALANILTEDIVYGLSWEPAPTPIRLTAGRLAIVFAAVLPVAIAVFAPTDPLRLWLWVLALTGSTVFPVLVLSIWWKRMNAFGAMAGLSTGFGVSVLVVLSGNAGVLPLDGALSGLIAIPASAIACLAVSALTPSPARHELELIRDIRIPGGEILYDREMRLLRQKKLQRGA
jgi:cation/acetate symporter